MSAVFLDHLRWMDIERVPLEERKQRNRVWPRQLKNNRPLVGGRYRFDSHFGERARSCSNLR